ncbi:MAG TPA: peptidylprolyl isomerase [Candidatus Tumulicola sp.]
MTWTVGAAAAAPQPYLQILTLESKRSLGDGALARRVASPDARIAARAALAIGRTKLPAGEPLLAAHLSDPRIPVRALAVFGLGLLATGENAPALVTKVSDPAGAVRVAAIDAIARYEAAQRLAGVESTAQSALEGALAHDRSPIVRSRAAVALVEFRNAPRAADAAVALSWALRTDCDVELRRHAMWAIYRGFAPAVGVGVVESALHDPDEVVRIEATRAMSRFKDAALADAVRPLLADASWRVAEQAAQTLQALAGKPPTEHWTAIPAFVHLPAIQPDSLAGLPALTKTPGKPSAPQPERAPFLSLFPATAAAMTSPAPAAHPRVRIVTTKGNVYVTLFPEWAPLTVANFLNLAGGGYYDGNRWFRIVPDFVVQTGDPHDDGNGDAGFTIGAEENPLEQRSYVLSMGLNYDDKTNAPIRDSAGTQYYVTLSPQYHLDRDFTVFGAVSGGFAVLAHLIESDRVVRVERIADETLR